MRERRRRRIASCIEALEARRLFATVWPSTSAGPAASFAPIATSSGTLPANFIAADVGAVPVAGNTSYAPDTFSMTGGGIVGGVADSFHFVYLMMGDTGSITMRVAAQQLADPAGRVGVMMRETLAVGANNVACAVTGAGVATFTYRHSSDAPTLTGPNAPPAGAGTWLRLVHDSFGFSAYQSSDGVAWTQLGTSTQGMNSPIYVGLFVASGSSSSATPATANFDHVSIPVSINRPGTNTSDSFYVRLDPTGVNFQLWHNLNPDASPPSQLVYRNNVGSLTLTGGNLGSDTLTVDLSNGNPLVVAASFDGGPGGTDQVKFIGSAGDDGGTITQSQFTFGGAVVNMPDANGAQYTGGAGDDTVAIQSVLSFSPVFNGGTGNDRFDINVGSIDLNSDAQLGTANLTIRIANASITFRHNQHLAGLVLNSGGRASVTPTTQYIQTGSLSIAPTGRFDLNDANLIVGYGSGPSPFTSIRDQVIRGYRGDIDANATGIVSSSAQAGGGAKILALFDNALRNASEWPPGSGNTVPVNSVIGHLTYFGDANFDDRVTGDDYTVIDSNLNTDPPVGMEWMRGDANTDGIVTGDDYTTIDSRLGLGAAGPMIAPAEVAPLSRPRDEDAAWDEALLG